MKNLSLNTLKVQSFVTTSQATNPKTVKGGTANISRIALSAYTCPSDYDCPTVDGPSCTAVTNTISHLIIFP